MVGNALRAQSRRGNLLAARRGARRFVVGVPKGETIHEARGRERPLVLVLAEPGLGWHELARELAPLAKSTSASDPLAAWRAHFPVETQRRGEEHARAGHVEILGHDGALVAGLVRGKGPSHEVEIDLRSQRLGGSACTCAAFREQGTCEHVWAVLEVVLGVPALGRAEPGKPAALEPASSVATWVASLQRVEHALDRPVAPEGSSGPACRVDYVLILDDPATVAGTVLETRCARPRSRGGFGKASPFDLLAPRKDVTLAADDRRIAALLRGADSALVAEPRRGKESRRVLDAEQTRALLPILCATGRLSWSKRTLAGRVLALDGGAPWKPCLSLSAAEDGAHLRLDAHLERAGEHGRERIDGRRVRGILAGDALGELVVLDESIVSARLGAGRTWFLLHTQHPPPPFPARDAPAVLLEVARRELDVDPGPGMEAWIEARRPVPHLLLAAPKHGRGGWSDVSGTVEFDYGVARVLATEHRPLLPTGRGVLRRYFEVENALVARAVGLGASASAPGTLSMPLARVPEVVRALGADGWVVHGEGAKWRALAPPRIAVSSGVDWFEIEGRFADASASEFPALLAALRRGERSVRLDDGTTGVVPDEWIARWKTALQLGEARGSRLRFRTSQAWFVELLLSEFADQESERLWNEQKKRLADFRRIAPVREPSGFHGELRPYQREGLGWLEFLERQRFGGCLADDMGLGKTVQVLAWLQARKLRDPSAAPALIVAPKSLTHNWIEEARRFTPGLTALEYVGTERKRLRAELERRDLILTTYGTMRSDIELLGALALGVVVLDEAQAIKNEGSRTARCVRLLHAEHRLALSGTPIENHLGELWSLFEFLNPGMLGRSSTFQALSDAPPGASDGVPAARRGDPDEDDDPDDTDADVEEGEPPAAGSDGEVRALIAQAVRPFLLRRTKEGVLRDLPERSEQTVLCDMEAEQEKEYVELREHFRRELLAKKSDAELARDKLGILEMLLRLRQAACHPGLLDASRANESCAKFDALFPMLEDVLESDHKALVFSQFTSFLALLRRRLDSAGRAYGYLDGKTPARERAAEVARFQEDPAQKLFLVSLKAGGTGLNLTAADYVFLLDPWWNPAVEAQAIARSHRIGQARNVFAYRLVCRDTIEERVLELQAKKRELASAILDGDGTRVRDLTREELERLLS